MPPINHLIPWFNKKPPLLLAAVLVLLVGNFASIIWLASRMTRIEEQSEVFSRSAVFSELGDSTGSMLGAGAKRLTSPGFHAQLPVNDTTSRLDDLKQGEALVPPEDLARSMDRLLRSQPANPDREMQHQQWLQEAASQMTSSDTPKAQGVDSTCQGSRCVVTATFADNNAAEMWAMRYLLTAGGKLLSNSRTVILPAPNGSTVTLQLYLY